jgi:photosystem II stability/assembly factor-like uncharacterized protein
MTFNCKSGEITVRTSVIGFLLTVLILTLIIVPGCSDKKATEPEEGGINLVVNPTEVVRQHAYGFQFVESQYLSISSSDGDTIPYEATTSSSWITLANASGATPDSVFAKIGSSSMPDGHYVDTVVISSRQVSNSPVHVVFDLTVITVIEFSTNRIVFWTPAMATLPDTSFIVLSGGGSEFSLKLSEHSDWFDISDTTGYSPDTIVVSFADISSFLPGRYVDSIRVYSDEISDTSYVEIELNITSWLPQYPEDSLGSCNLSSVHFVDVNNGWAVGYASGASGDDSFGTILKTVNGGQTWQLNRKIISFEVARGLGGVFFTDASKGWVVGDEGSIFRTIDAGSNWDEQNSGLPADSLVGFEDVCFSSATTGCIVGKSGTILRTGNGGNTWLKRPSGTDALLTDVFFVDADLGWIVGNRGALLRTVNGGNDWTALSLPSPLSTTDLRGVTFVDAAIGWIVGMGGTIAKTIDGGLTWTLQSSGTDGWLSAIDFISADRGWIVGENATILFTDNGGQTWFDQSIVGLDKWLFSVSFVNANKGWIVGQDKTILSGEFSDR